MDTIVWERGQRPNELQVVTWPDTLGAREVAEALKKRILAIQKLCRISAALRQDWNWGNDFVGFLVVRNEHHRRDASLFSIAVQFPKL